MVVVKKKFEENTFVIAFDTNRYYKAKILKCTPMKSSWKYFIHYNKWDNKYDKWVDENLLKEIDSNYEKLNWGIKGYPPSIDKKFLAAASTDEEMHNEEDSMGLKLSKNEVEAAKYNSLVEEERLMEKKRLDLVKENIFDDVSIPTISSGNVVESSSNSKQNISIPMLLKKLMVDEWSQITLELPKTKLLRLPRPYCVASIIAMFMQHKHSVLIANSSPEDASENADIYESYEDLFKGLQRHFDASLSMTLLYRNERIQLAHLRKIFEDKYPERNMLPSEIYGVEHLMRLMVKLPVGLNSISVVNADTVQDANKMVMRMNELLKFITKNQAMFYTTNPRKMDMDANTAIVEPSYKFEEEVLTEMRCTDFNVHFDILSKDLSNNATTISIKKTDTVKAGNSKIVAKAKKGAANTNQKLDSVGVGTKSKRGSR